MYGFECRCLRCVVDLFMRFDFNEFAEIDSWDNILKCWLK